MLVLLLCLLFLLVFQVLEDLTLDKGTYLLINAYVAIKNWFLDRHINIETLTWFEETSGRNEEFRIRPATLMFFFFTIREKVSRDE